MDLATQDRISPREAVFGTFRLGSNEFGINATVIREVINAPARYQPNPLCPDYIIGTLTLRRTVIPVVDLASLFYGTESEDGAPTGGKVAIIEAHGQPVGFLFDDTIDVFRSTHPGCEFVDVESFDATGATRGAYWFNADSRVVQILDPTSIIEAHGTPPALNQDMERADESLLGHRGPAQKSIAFQVGDLQMAIDMADVEEVFSGGGISRTDIANGALLGAHDLRGNVVPLLDLGVVFRIRQPKTLQDLSGRSIILIRHESGRVGLVVDRIKDLVEHYADELLQYPGFALDTPDLFLGCITEAVNGELILVNPRGLLNTPDVQVALNSCAEFFGTLSEGASVQSAGRQTLRSYLTFKFETLFAVPLSEIVEVVEHPDELLHPPMINPVFDGVLNLRGEFIATTSVQTLYGSRADGESHRHIIVFDAKGKRYGLAVPHVTSIIHIDPDEEQPLPFVLQKIPSQIAADVDRSLLLNVQGDDPPIGVSLLNLSRVTDRTSGQPDGKSAV